MNATTVKEAKKNLDRLIRQVNADAEPTIICSDQGQKAVLLSLEEFNSWQGHSVFEFNPDESQRLSWLGCQPAACRRDIRMARPPQQPNRGVAKRCHDLGDTATAHL